MEPLDFGPFRDLDRAGLGILALGQLDLEQAVLEARLDLLPVHVVGKAEAPRKAAVGALDAVVVLSVLLLLELALAGDRQHPVLGRDRDLVLLESGELRRDHDPVLLLVDVDRGNPRRQRLVVTFGPTEGKKRTRGPG
jgi:hypothetical protein